MKIPHWAILPFESGHHIYIQNAACQLGIPAVFPMVTGYNARHKIKTQVPALGSMIFLPANEDDIDRLRSGYRFFEKPWRNSAGDLETIPNAELQTFMTNLAQRDKKAAKAPRTVKLADLAGKAAFTLWARLFGQQEAIKRFGDLREAV